MREFLINGFFFLEWTNSFSLLNIKGLTWFLWLLTFRLAQTQDCMQLTRDIITQGPAHTYVRIALACYPVNSTMFVSIHAWVFDQFLPFLSLFIVIGHDGWNYHIWYVVSWIGSVLGHSSVIFFIDPDSFQDLDLCMLFNTFFFLHSAGESMLYYKPSFQQSWSKLIEFFKLTI